MKRILIVAGFFAALSSSAAIAADTPQSVQDSELATAHKVCTAPDVFQPAAQSSNSPFVRVTAPLQYRSKYSFCTDVEAEFTRRNSAAAKETARAAASAIADKLKAK